MPYSRQRSIDPCVSSSASGLYRITPPTDHLGLTSRVPPQEVIAMSDIYVDDFLTAGPSPVVRSFLATLRKMWKTSDPQYLTMDAELPFLRSLDQDDKRWSPFKPASLHFGLPS